MHIHTFRRGLSLVLFSVAAGCSSDRTVNPVAERVPQSNDSSAAAASTLVDSLAIGVGQSVRLRPSSTSRTSRLRWTSSAPSVASVDIDGTVVARSIGTARVSVSGFGAAEAWAISVSGPRITAFSISPRSNLSIAPGGTQQFNVSTTWSDGLVHPAIINYSSTGGTINATGLFSAGSVTGSFLVVASCLCVPAAWADTAVISIVAPAQLTKLALTPKSTTVKPGETVRFAASANWSTGATDIPPLTWSASGGTISNVGVYVAPPVGGDYRVIVAHSGGTLRDTAIVTVEAGPPVAPPSDFTPNRPPGLNLVVDTRFGNLLPNGGYNADSLALEYDARNATHENAPFGRNVFEIFYPGNHAGNGTTGGWLYGPGGQGWRRLYFSIMVWVPSNYSTHSVGEKFFYPFITTPGEPVQSSYVDWRPLGADTPSGPTFGLGLVTQTTNIPTRVFTPPSLTSARVTKGKWTMIEVYWVMNSVGQRNGIFRAWVDGRLAADFNDVVFSGATKDSFFDRIRFTGTRGGGVSNTLTPPEGQVRRYNRLAFFGSRN